MNKQFPQSRLVAALSAALSLASGFFSVEGQAQKPVGNRAKPDQHSTRVTYNTAKIDGLDIFYREAGDPSRPTILLLHGFPASSHMFRNLIPALADRFHLVAPDYPGFGQSAALYSQWQAYFRKYQPPTLIVWGKNDQIFPAEGAEPYKRDLKRIEFHLLDTGHFALEEDGDVIATYIRDFFTAQKIK